MNNHSNNINKTDKSDFNINNNSEIPIIPASEKTETDASELSEQNSQETETAEKTSADSRLQYFKKHILKDRHPLTFLSQFASFKKKRITAGVVITALLLLLIFTHTGLYLNDDGISRQTGTGLLILSAFLSVLCGFGISVSLNLPKRAARIYSFIMYFGAPVVAALITECIQGIFIYNWSPKTFFLNYLMFLVLYSIAAVFTGNFRRTLLIMTPLLFAFSFGSMLIMEFRGTPLMPADLVTISTGLAVASNYRYTLTCSMILAVILFMLFEIMIFHMPKLKVRRRFHLFFRLLSLVLVTGTCSAFYLTSIAADNNIKPDFWNQARGYKNTGTIFNFVLNSRYLIIEKPENYNASEIPSYIDQVISSAEEDGGIFDSAKKMQEKQLEILASENSLTAGGTEGDGAAVDPADTAVTVENTGTLENTDQPDETEKNDITSGLYNLTGSSVPESETGDSASVPDLPNTGTDTKLAVQYTSDTEQPAASAVLKEGDVPDIIVVMNETLSDLRILGELSTNKDYMPFLRNLTKNTIKGNLYMPVNGAGTSNSEFEFLTGNAMAFLPAGSNAYELYIKSKLPSLAQILGDQGYSRIAYHTYYKESWKRNINYPLLGFENYYALEDILDTPTVDAYRDGEISLFEYQMKINQLYPDEKVLLRRFVSDSYDYKVLERMYEERNTEYPFFIFNVTMQNHGSYDLSYANFDQQIQLTSTDTFYPKANRYLSLMYESDKALKELVDYYSKVSRPVMLVMFGDHQPAIEESFIESLLQTDLSNVTISQNQKRYATPFLIWTNYNSESGYIEKMSCNYLSTLILQQAGLKGTVYNEYLSALYQKIPVIDTVGYITADNKYYTYDDKTEYTAMLDGYRKIIYNYMFDHFSRNKNLFYLPSDTNPAQ